MFFFFFFFVTADTVQIITLKMHKVFDEFQCKFLSDFFNVFTIGIAVGFRSNPLRDILNLYMSLKSRCYDETVDLKGLVDEV
jgi:hypothetical protein